MAIKGLNLPLDDRYIPPGERAEWMKTRLIIAESMFGNISPEKNSSLNMRE